MTGAKERPRGPGEGGDGDGTDGPFSYASIAPQASPVNGARCFICGAEARAHLCHQNCRHTYSFLAVFGWLAFCASCSRIVGAAPITEVRGVR